MPATPSPPPGPHTDHLTERIVAILAPLGGVTAVAARRLRPQPRSAGVADAQREDAGKARNAVLLADRVALRAEVVMPAASLIKISIAVELMRRADLGQYDLSERMDTALEPRVGGGGVLDYLNPDTRFTLHDLCTLMLIVSDNTAANFLLDLLGMGEINETMSRLNLDHTRLARRLMDFAARAAHRENQTTAAEMVTLLSLIRGGALPGGRDIATMLAAQQLFGQLADTLPQSASLAHKSGSLDDTFSDAGILSGPRGACVYCVLTTDQVNIPRSRAAICEVVRTLWDAWCG